MVHLRRPGSLLWREGEHPGPLNLLLPEERAQLLEFRLSLAGESGNEAGPQDQAGDSLPEGAEQPPDGFLGIPAVHGLEDAVVAVLYGNIQIGQNLRLCGNGVDQLLRNLVGVEIVETNPVEIQLGKLPEQSGQLVFPVQVRAVAGDVLGDDQQLLHPGGGQLRRLVQKLPHGAAAVSAPEGGDDAVSAVVVASLGNPEIGVPRGRGEDAGAVLGGGVDIVQMAGTKAQLHDLGNCGGDVAIASGTQDAVDLRQLRQHVGFVALGHAAGDQDFFQSPGPFQLRQMEDAVDGLLAGGGQEAAGVHHRRVGPGGVRDDFVACGLD